MKREMRQRRREITDPAIISAMLDRMEILYLGINDGPAPYVVPLNFGFAFVGDGDLEFYFHCARQGHKLDCLARDPNVCVTAASFVSYANASVKGHLHDYRSVIARGVAQQIDPEKEPEAFRQAMTCILVHNHRDPADMATPVMRHLQIWRVLCRREDVSAKAEIPPQTATEVDFAPPAGDGTPIDDSHILDMYTGSKA
ncbi:MAG: pyridoxamine 5'-phosphate oxidase family protein [Clostridia bacterium]|nr:pyridoxamine 5'-phosphate oxidase family protein [Clostridia bacterium]